MENRTAGFYDLDCGDLAHFNLDCKEFAKILAKPKEERAEILLYLSGAQDLSPYLYEAIADAARAADEHAGDYPWVSSDRAKVKDSLSRLKGWNEFHELRSLGLYRLARKAVLWTNEMEEHPLTDELKFLSKFVVKDDTWRTFVGFGEAWAKKRPHTIAGLLEYLPEWVPPSQDPEELFGDSAPKNNSPGE